MISSRVGSSIPDRMVLQNKKKLAVNSPNPGKRRYEYFGQLVVEFPLRC